MKRYFPIIISLVLALIVSAMFFAGFFESLELLTIDFRYRTRTAYDSDRVPPIVVVAIDQNSIKEMGKWPIPRKHYITVLENIYDAGAKGVLMDMDFSSAGPDPGQDEAFVKYLRQTGTVVLAAQMEEKVTNEDVLVRNVSLPIPGLMDAALAVGSITFELDPDGVVRKMPPSIDYIDETYSPLGAVGAAMIDPDSPSTFPDQAMIDFRVLMRPMFPIVPFLEVLRGDIADGLFSDKIVFLGATASDLHDIWLTPMGVTPGVFIQVAVFDTAMKGSWMTRQGAAATIVLVLFFSLLSGLAIGGRGWKGGAAVWAILILIVTVFAVLAAGYGRFIQVVPLYLVCTVMYPVQLAMRAVKMDLSLARERGKTEALLSIADLRVAEEEGHEAHFAPLVLLGKNLELSDLQILTWPDPRSEKVTIRRIIGSRHKLPEPQAIQEVRSRNISIAEKRRGEGTTILVPLVTVRQTMGVLYAESRREVDVESEDVRLLLSFATQTAYFLESLALDLRVKDLYINTIRAISRALDSKDQFTSAHSELSVDHVERFGRICGLEREQVESLHVGALLHDIGKIGVPDSILAKEGKLSDKEYETIKNHPVIGSSIVDSLPFPEDVKMIILHHHERYDGTGYPDGLKGYEIPLLVRIFSILDVYEALVGFRPYRKPMDAQSAADLLKESAGSHFDPYLVDIFIKDVLLLESERPDTSVSTH